MDNPVEINKKLLRMLYKSLERWKKVVEIRRYYIFANKYIFTFGWQYHNLDPTLTCLGK